MTTNQPGSPQDNLLETADQFAPAERGGTVYLEQVEANATKLGTHGHGARDAEEHNAVVFNIFPAHRSHRHAREAEVSSARCPIRRDEFASKRFLLRSTRPMSQTSNAQPMK